MAIAQMAKVMLVTHRSQAAELLEALQRDGICQILNAQQAAVAKDMPELAAAAERPKDLEQLLSRLEKNITFLTDYAPAQKGLASILAPRTVITEQSYDQTIADSQIPKILEQSEQTKIQIEKLNSEIENLDATLDQLAPWQHLETPVHEIGRMQQTTALAGLIPAQQLQQITEQLSEQAAVIDTIAQVDNKYACIIVAINENLSDVQKLLRSAEFEPVSFEPMTGTVAELTERYTRQLNESTAQLSHLHEQAAQLAENLLKLQILYDHYGNLLQRERTKDTAPATESTVILEGWVRQKDYPRLEKIVSCFEASTLARIEPAEGEEIPVEIENTNAVKPFEVITRLYGMPKHFEVDPTAFLAPFFALFFALCLTDAGYGLVIVALIVFFMRKIQGDKKLMWMLGICSAVTIVTGALTGGWFGDAVQQFVPALKPLREKMMWFDPFEKPMMFFGLSLALGYTQIMAGLLIAFVHNLKQKDYVAAVCDQLTWLVMLNSIVIFTAAKAGVLPPQVGTFFGILALMPAATIFLFSQREGPLIGRFGMGLYNLFSAIFYLGDVLSYLRLMALGMVTAGIAMAVNVISKVAVEILSSFGVPESFGIVVMILVLLVGHTVNLALNALGAFVHTLRLQYAEFFPKFLIGGGKLFQPLSKNYKHIYVKKI
jgi:V/A-type H+-transporting ATPase subunit I